MPHDYQDNEFLTPYLMLQEAGYTIDIAGFSMEPARGSFGHMQTPTILLTAISAEQIATYAALVIPGGMASPTYLWHNATVQELVRNFHVAGCIIATICYACIVPVQAGILTGKLATVYPTDDSLPILAEHNVTFSNEGCVTLEKERIITAQGPKFAEIFGKAILAMLSASTVKQPETITTFIRN